jgi:hypothetical protein
VAFTTNLASPSANCFDYTHPNKFGLAAMGG